MKKKIIIISVLVIVVGFIAIAFIASNNKSTLKAGEKNFAYTDTANITKIFLSDKNNNSVVIEKQNSGIWNVNKDYVAQPEMTQELLRTIMYITVKNPVPRSMHNTVVGNLASNSIKVEIFATVYTIDFLNIKLFPRERIVRTYYVGTNTQDNVGTFMLMDKADMAFVVHIPGFKGFLHTRYSPILDDWRDHGVFRYTLPQIAKVEIDYPASPEYSFTISNNNNKFSVANSQKQVINTPDTIRIINYLNAFTDVRYELLLSNKHEMDSIKAIKPMMNIAVTNQSGNRNKISLIKMKVPEGTTNIAGEPIEYDLERLFCVMNDKEVAIVQYYVFGSLIKSINFFVERSATTTEENTKFETIL